ncbi:MAG: shikimate kinase, partial [Leptolyngbyaceae cyanobacterium MO_188.B28]|nr:shikimate kinase [Leptolyngbyaceae cyanobacterium MO_188.B28]
RQLETQVLSQLSAYTRLVIATGGGMILKRQNWSYLHYGIVVWLDVSADQLQARLEGDTSRPLLDSNNLRSKLETLLAQRRHLYAQADVRMTVTPEETPTAIAIRTLAELSQVVTPETAPTPRHD